jgi:hypothetical protein
MSMDLTEQAIGMLLERRWPMIPSTGPAKKPCVGWKQFQQQLPTGDKLREWGRKFKPERWGVITGKLAGVVAVDFDGEQGREFMHDWGLDPHVRTGSGGFHVYVQHPGWRVPTLNAKSGKLSWPWPGVDVRGDGGFALLIGRNKNGPYVQLRELVAEPFEILPAELREFLQQHSAKADQNLPKPAATPPDAATGNVVDSGRLVDMALDIASQSGRNNAGFWLCCQLRDNGYSFGDAEAAMRDYRSRAPFTNTKGKPEPYTEREMNASLGEAYSRPARTPWERRSSNPHRGRARTGPSNEQGTRGTDDSPAQNQEPLHDNDADDSGSIGIYVVHTGEPVVGHTGEPLSRYQYSRVPREVAEDRRLKARDIRVYSVLAGFCWQGNVSQVGKRRIARLAACAERLVVESLKRLEATGHLQKNPGRRRGQRGRYVLTSAVFGQKQRAGVEEVAAGPGGRLRLVSVRKDHGTASRSGLHSDFGDQSMKEHQR